jgi:hypothetical protein
MLSSQEVVLCNTLQAAPRVDWAEIFKKFKIFMGKDP